MSSISTMLAYVNRLSDLLWLFDRKHRTRCGRQRIAAWLEQHGRQLDRLGLD